MQLCTIIHTGSETHQVHHLVPKSVHLLKCLQLATVLACLLVECLDTCVVQLDKVGYIEWWIIIKVIGGVSTGCAGEKVALGGVGEGGREGGRGEGGGE